MTLDWDYSSHAATYDKRPGYSPTVWKQLAERLGIGRGDAVADIGAGTGILTRLLLEQGYRVTAVEPNDAMRRRGMQNTAMHDLTWTPATAENTELPGKSFRAVVFGSSFNVVNQQRALEETARILMPDGWFACLWNHRRLDDPVQARVEGLIHQLVPNFEYGTRRDDPKPTIAGCRRFGTPEPVEAQFVHQFSARDYVDAWRSHATLARHAGPRFETVIDAIRRMFLTSATIDVPYVTRAWCAPLLPPGGQ